MTTIDLNSDLGENVPDRIVGDDEAMLRVVSSANVACGFHAGDPTTLRRTCALAAEAGVVVGAQVGYRDLAGFGRRFVNVAPGELADDDLRDEHLGSLPGSGELHDVHAEVVGLHEPGQRAALAERRDVTGRVHVA